MTEGQEEIQRTREFLVIWRLKNGPMTQEELLSSFGFQVGSDEASVMIRVVKGLARQGLVLAPGGRPMELTDEGKALIKTTSETFAATFAETIADHGEGGKG